MSSMRLNVKKEKSTQRKWQKSKIHPKKVAKKKKPPGGSGNSSRSSTPASSNREKHRQLPRPRSPVEVQTVGTKNMILEDGVRSGDQFVMSSIVSSQYIVFVPIWSNDWWDLSILIWNQCFWFGSDRSSHDFLFYIGKILPKNSFTMSHYTNTQMHKYTNT